MKQHLYTNKELGLLFFSGLILTFGAIWYLQGIGVAVLILGVALMWLAIVCARITRDE